MSTVDSILDAAFTNLLLKAQQEELPAVTRPIVIPINFTIPANAAAIGSPTPTITFPAFPGFVMVPCPSTLVTAVMLAMDDHLNLVAANASIDLRMTSYQTLGSSISVYGPPTSMPTLPGAQATVFDTSTWQRNFRTGDILLYNLFSFTGPATVVGLLLLLRPTDVPQGVEPLTDSAGAPIVDTSGNSMVLNR